MQVAESTSFAAFDAPVIGEPGRFIDRAAAREVASLGRPVLATIVP